MHFGLVCIVFGVLFYSDLFTRQLVHTVRCVVGLALCTTVDFGICSIVVGDTCNIELVPIKSKLKYVFSFHHISSRHIGMINSNYFRFSTPNQTELFSRGRHL